MLNKGIRVADMVGGVLRIAVRDRRRIDHYRAAGFELEFEGSRSPTSSGILMIVTPRLRGVLEQGSDEIEFLPVEVWHKKRSVGSAYILNILSVVDATDWVHTEYEDWDEEHLAIRGNLTIDLDKARGHDVFVLARTVGAIICVSERLVASTRAAKVRGVRFVPPPEMMIPRKRDSGIITL